MAQWRSGAVAQWRSGAVAQWRSGAVAQWRSGAVARASDSPPRETPSTLQGSLFTPRAIRIWNMIPPHITEIENPIVFQIAIMNLPFKTLNHLNFL